MKSKEEIDKQLENIAANGTIEDAIEFFENNDLDINYEDYRGRTMLELICFNDNSDLGIDLLEEGANPNISSDSRSLLHYIVFPHYNYTINASLTAL